MLINLVINSYLFQNLKIIMYSLEYVLSDSINDNLHMTIVSHLLSSQGIAEFLILMIV